jgi:hypothetical protein
MKRHAPYALSLLLSFIVTTGFSQNNNPKPKQFSNFPETINCSEQELSKVFTVSPDYSNTIFQVSKITNGDGSISYIGRIINKNYFDGFELNKNASGNYQLKKIETDRVIPDCAQ